MISNKVIHKSKMNLSPRLIYEALGSKIIEFDSIALAEQIKNAIDARAQHILVDFSLYYDDIITISDDGVGMNIEDIQKNWLFVGTENKTNDYSQLGGKGIGRFSLFRLADNIQVESINEGIKYEFFITKSELESKVNTSNINIDIIETPINNFEKSGTKIVLSKVNPDLNFKEIQKHLENFNVPFTEPRYKIKYPTKCNLNKFLKPNDAIIDAPIRVEAEFEADKLLSYSFKCIVNGKELYSTTEITGIEKEVLKSNLNVDIGKTKLIIYSFYFHNTYKIPMKYGHKVLTNDFLSAYQGISVYRNNCKIFGHGEEDWLKLAEKRLQKAGENIDNKQTFGYVILDPYKSGALEEKTSREGFIRSKTSNYFRDFIEIIVKKIGLDRKISIKKIKEYLKEQKINKNNTSNSLLNDKPNVPLINKSNLTGKDSTIKGKENISHNENDSLVKEIQTVNDFSRYQSRKSIGSFDQNIKRMVKAEKVVDLLNEITTIDVVKYSFATAFLFRSLVEVSMNEYLLVNLSLNETYFKDYIITENKNIKRKFNNDYKDISIRKKIMDFKGLLKNTNEYDSRSLKHLDDLAIFIDDINLAIHWSDKKVSIDSLQTHWSNSKFFLEFLCKGISL